MPKFAVYIPTMGDCNCETVSKLVRWVEKLGYDSVWVGDHFSLKQTIEGVGSNQIDLTPG
jgi:alkanesulfonate monooxygenase SsuD/methylene tetrahydromethanopterin reductase-like flavin-dependent oxidoreductase (luciferase family)